MTDSLTAKQTAFVSAFMDHGNASQAAASAGYKPREAARLQAHPAIAAEIGRRRAAAAPEPAPDAEVSTETLIAEADKAYRVAESERSSAGMVAASQLKAKLTGKLQGGTQAAAEEAEAEPVSDRELARATMGALYEMREILGVDFIMVPPCHKAIAIPTGETILRMKDPTLASLFKDQYGEALEIEPNLDAVPLPRVTVENTATPGASHPAHRRLGRRHGREYPGERETLPNGYSIAFEAYETDNKLRSVWRIYTPEGELTGADKLTREDAVQLAANLAEMRK